MSTAFCNIDQMVYSSPIVEKVYPAKMDWRKLIEFVETNDDELISVVEAKVLDTHVNTYLFTKHLAENVIEDAAHIIPVTISRPPIGKKFIFLLFLINFHFSDGQLEGTRTWMG